MLLLWSMPFALLMNVSTRIKSNNHVHFAKAIRGDIGAQYHYGYNVQALSKNVDTTKLMKYIEDYGANGLYVSYMSAYEAKLVNVKLIQFMMIVLQMEKH